MNMNGLIFIVIFGLFAPVYGANFIDNPSFDLDHKGWNIFPKEKVSYLEENRHQIIQDQYYDIKGGFAYYGMWCVATDLPLYFAVEAAPGKSNNPEAEVELEVKIVEIEIFSRTKMGECRVPKDRFFDVLALLLYPPFQIDYINSKGIVLTRKRVKLKGAGQWHLITSDYPAYKKYRNSRLALVVTAIDINSVFSLNYAQVGSDPRGLGGRGPRARQTVN